MIRPSRLHRLQTLIAVGLACWTTGCVTPTTESDPTKSTATPSAQWKYKTADSVLLASDVKGKTPEVFEKPIAEVRVAALRALSFVGCQIEHREDFYVSGRRPNKIGFFVGSGGETVEVFLYPAAENTTQVWIDTDLSYFGIAGQQGWNDQVKAEMQRLLSQPTTTTTKS